MKVTLMVANFGVRGMVILLAPLSWSLSWRRQQVFLPVFVRRCRFAYSRTKCYTWGSSRLLHVDSITILVLILLLRQLLRPTPHSRRRRQALYNCIEGTQCIITAPNQICSGMLLSSEAQVEGQVDPAECRGKAGSSTCATITYTTFKGSLRVPLRDLYGI